MQPLILKEKQNRLKELTKENEELTKKFNEMNKTISKDEFKTKLMEEYDIIFNCDSFLQPFEIKTTKSYREELKLRECPIVSVMGNFDRGKSFILSEISGKSFPSGFNAVTPWICGYYPLTLEEIEIDNKNESLHYLNALLLDSAGFGTPLQYNLPMKVF